MSEKVKKRKTVNVSLQKRHIDYLNEILNSWEEDGCNISNEICEAIIFKNKSDINPHICTILSTLSLIESSIKAQKNSKTMTQEEIDTKTLEIFNDVITIEIDGNKLTNLLKGVNLKNQPSNETNPKNSKEEIININEINNDESACDEEEMIIPPKEEIINYENNKNINKDKQVFESKESKEKELEPIVWKDFPKENKINKNSENRDSIFGNFAIENNFTV